MKRKKTILLANNFKIVNKGIRISIWREREQYMFIGEVSTMEDLFVKLNTCKPDILILPHRLLNTLVAGYLPLIKEASPDTKILMFTMVADIDILLDTIENVDGLVFQSAEIEVFLKALDMVANGGRYIQVPN
jgi:DNA-binding NarL/FixJ family response regulator